MLQAHIIRKLTSVGMAVHETDLFNKARIIHAVHFGNMLVEFW